MTKKQQIEFAIERWMNSKDSRKKKLALLWSEDIPEIADLILEEIGDVNCKESVVEENK